MDEWNSKQYLKFEIERTQPAIDLANRITVRSPKKIVDIGCGPGNSTAVLKKIFNASYVLGVDNSQNMIDAAKEKHCDIDFKLYNASRNLSTLGNDFDIVFSNACIQWVPNHQKLIPEMLNLLKSSGMLLVQTPMNEASPIQLVLAEMIKSEKWIKKFPNPRKSFNLSPGEYFDLLNSCATEFSMWETDYYHTLDSHQAIIDWCKSTALRPFLNCLTDDKKIEFEREIHEKILPLYPTQVNGSVIFKFKRFFFTAIK